MDSSWRPETVDPLGQAFGVPAAKERPYEFWLDLRTSELTFAQMVVMKLFYAVRRVVDEAGCSLPNGAAVQGLLFDEQRYDRADTIGQDLPIYVSTASGLVNATQLGSQDPLPMELRTVASVDQLQAAEDELQDLSSTNAVSAIALPADAMLWASALTGRAPRDLECLAGNEGA